MEDSMQAIVGCVEDELVVMLISSCRVSLFLRR